MERPAATEELSASEAARLSGLFERQRRHFATGMRRNLAAQRIQRLTRLRDWVLGHRDELREALRQDFRKPAAEVDATEILPLTIEIRHIARRLRRWMRPRRVGTPLALLGTRSYVVPQPRGVVLILSPWNFPFMLAASPLVSAIAAGNCVVLKPSELSPRTSALLARMVGDLFPSEEVAVVEGGAEVANGLLSLPFNHVFFTGSTRVGRIVMQAAAESLASVTLELGGKSPVIVEESADLRRTAERIVWGKFLNAGQTCVAPDYVLVDRRRHDALLDALSTALERAYPGDDDAIRRSPDYARVIDDRHFRRLSGLLEDALARGARLHRGGATAASERFIAPTILSDVDPGSRLMQEEIFGPLLPVLSFDTLAAAIEFVKERPRPLALYVFARSDPAVQRILDETAAGGTAVNDTVVQFLHPELPFGGVNASGLGRAHGLAGFLELSNSRAVLYRGRFNPVRSIGPPYTRGVLRRIGAMLRWL